MFFSWLRPHRDLAAAFIRTDAFSHSERQCRRRELAHRHLRGDGLEIGALHRPLEVEPTRARVRYVDYKSREENRQRYPELADSQIVETDVLDDGFILASVPDRSVDFLIANHALEHSPDPLGTVGCWLGKIRRGGMLFVTVPIAARCYDEGRPLTSLEHFLEDHRQFTGVLRDDVLDTTRDHLREFIEISGANIRRMNRLPPIDAAQNQKLLDELMAGLTDEIRCVTDYTGLMNAHIQRINRIYDVHYHTFSPTSYERFLRQAARADGAELIDVIKNGGGECVGIVRTT